MDLGRDYYSIIILELLMEDNLVSDSLLLLVGLATEQIEWEVLGEKTEDREVLMEGCLSGNLSSFSWD